MRSDRQPSDKHSHTGDRRRSSHRHSSRQHPEHTEETRNSLHPRSTHVSPHDSPSGSEGHLQQAGQQPSMIEGRRLPPLPLRGAHNLQRPGMPPPDIFHPRYETNEQYRVLEPAGTQQRAMQQAYGQTPSEGSSRHTYQPQYAHHQPQQHSSYQALPQAQLVFQSPTQQSPQQQPQYNTHLYNPSRRPSLAPRTTLSSTEYRNEPSETMVGKAGLPEQRPPCGIKAKFKDEDDQLLRKLKEDYPYLGLTWKQISDFFPGRSAGTLQVRYCTKIRKKDILWNDDTIARLQRAIIEVDNDKWRQVAQKLGHSYTADACKDRAAFQRELEAAELAQQRGEADPVESDESNSNNDSEEYEEMEE